VNSVSESLSIVVGDYPHTELVKSRDSYAGLPTSFPHVFPVHDAFDDMVRHQRYHVCELAIGAFLQAREAGKPLLLLPAVLVGGFHHQSIYLAPDARRTAPGELKGARIGVRAYSQTTGLWVRGWLAEEYGVPADSVTWVTTEGSHSDQFHDPKNVRQIDGSLIDALRRGDIDAAILGAAAAPPDLQPLLEDPLEQDRQWFAEHGQVPINHMVVATEQMVQRHPDALREMYRALCAGIDAGAAATGPGGLPTAVRHGRERIRDTLRIAAEYAHAQGLIARPVTDLDALFAPGLGD
jgi:4,5-dihydroxyphthalate decarboxylase